MIFFEDMTWWFPTPCGAMIDWKDSQGQEVCCILECKQKYQHIVSVDDFSSAFLSVKGGEGRLLGEVAEWVGLCPKKEPFYTGH